MKAFVTGGTGFLGAHLIRELSKEGWELQVLRREKSDISRIKDLPGVEFVLTKKDSQFSRNLSCFKYFFI
jgi:nucleoside-diphosphate-sugar epimerase